MANEDIILSGEHFISLDEFNTISQDEIAKCCPMVQIIYSANKNSNLNIEEIKRRVGHALRSEEKENNLFTITLNVDSDYVKPYSGE